MDDEIDEDMEDVAEEEEKPEPSVKPSKKRKSVVSVCGLLPPVSVVLTRSLSVGQ